MLQRFILILFIALLPGIMVGQTKTGSPASAKAFTVVIDAGHGGHDPGALGKIVQEKALNLEVSLKLGRMIEENYPDVKVFYTRKTDVFLTLQERANFVNKHNADLFICVHTNSAKSTAAVGAETFVLGIDKQQSNLDVAMRENSVMLLEDDQTAYEGFDPKSVDSYIMFELMQDTYMDQSLQFATLVQKEFSGTLNLSDRGVRQAGFWVLHKSACPSVLVEMGFISNPTEEKYLASQKGKDDIAKAVFTAFETYKSSIDKKNGVTTAAKAEKEVVKADKEVVKAEKKTAKPEAKAEPKPEAKPVAKSEPKAEAKPAVKAEQKTEPKVEPQEETMAEAVAEVSKPIFRVQIFSTTKQLPAKDPTFKGLTGCKFTRDGKFYKYTYGEVSTYEEAAKIQKEIQGKFKDCFIVAFLDGKQILVKDARAMLK